MLLSDPLILEESLQDVGMPVPVIPNDIVSETSRSIATQTNLTVSDLSSVLSHTHMFRTENIGLKESVKEANDHMDASYFKGDDEKVVFFHWHPKLLCTHGSHGVF